jgi:hypothetical protein
VSSASPISLEHRSQGILGGWPFLSHPTESAASPCGLGTCFLSTSALLVSTFWGCTIPLLRGGGFDGELTPLAWAAGWRQASGVCVQHPVVSVGKVSTRRSSSLRACRPPPLLSVSSCHIAGSVCINGGLVYMLLDGRLFEELR